MTPGRIEPYQRTVAELRERVRTGALAPGARVTAKDVAEELGLSPTPVREALARLAGEGLLEERRGDGFFARNFSAADIDGLFRLSLSILRESVALPRRARPDLVEALSGQVHEDPVRAVERLFMAWVAEGQGAVLIEKHQLLVCQLGPVRRAEAKLFDDLPGEAQALLDLAADEAADRVAAVVQFHARRLSEVSALALAVGPIRA